MVSYSEDITRYGQSVCRFVQGIHRMREAKRKKNKLSHLHCSHYWEKKSCDKMC